MKHFHQYAAVYVGSLLILAFVARVIQNEHSQPPKWKPYASWGGSPTNSPKCEAIFNPETQAKVRPSDE